MFGEDPAAAAAAYRRVKPVTLELAWNQGYTAGRDDQWKDEETRMASGGRRELSEEGTTANPYATADAPSGNALDRATALLAKRYISVSQNPALVEDVAKLIERADRADELDTQVSLLSGDLDAAAARNDAPSGDALDRAHHLLTKTGYVPVGATTLLNEVAKLIDRADAPADKEQIGGHGALHWHTAAERRLGQIYDLDKVVRRRNDRIAELEQQLEDKRRSSPSFARTIDELEGMVMERNGRIAELEQQLARETRTAGSEIDSLQRKLEVADRQRREFLGHSRTANAARQELERRVDELEASAGKAVQTATTDQLLEEIRQRLNT